ncbi:hypothetical protein DEU56DRAFT_12112 [Suillus clintonianus]|uniref:uncharacterized protein n=1 Tax=Suillus clintonianus TaxID=1904413 RepID=UPI001B880256|nr:uncharacterized protein DEU56DRAFT_12112 [Suillus clintonianus]KAG2157272.1 hypothetical protein DEU56DRAFT_12112 [Suillus clintonianus]
MTLKTFHLYRTINLERVLRESKRKSDSEATLSNTRLRTCTKIWETLSRDELERRWLARQINARRMKSKGLTPEEITAQPRAERKLDRAKEIAAAAEAETTFKEESRVIAPGIAPDGTRITPSAATWWKPKSASVPPKQSFPDLALDEEEEIEPIQDLGHLQLFLYVTFPLVWALDCLTINVSFTLAETWNALQNAHITSLVPQLNTPSPPRFDNPFLLYRIPPPLLPWLVWALHV